MESLPEIRLKVKEEESDPWEADVKDPEVKGPEETTAPPPPPPKAKPKKKKHRPKREKLERPSLENSAELSATNMLYRNCQNVVDLETFVFNPLLIQALEVEANHEFFVGSTTKTPARYQLLRNRMVSMWNMMKPRYLSKSQARVSLRRCGDVNSIGRVHDFLERVGWINSGVVFGRYVRTKQSQNEALRPPCGDTRVRITNELLLLMDLHCRLFENAVGLLTGTVRENVVVVSEVLPLNCTGEDAPRESVVGIYHAADVVYPRCFDEYFLGWRVEVVFVKSNTSFRFLNRDVGRTDVGVVEIDKSVQLSLAHPLVVRLLQLYLVTQE